MDLRCHWPPGTPWLAMQGLSWVQAGGHAGPGTGGGCAGPEGGESLFPPQCILIRLPSVKASSTFNLTAGLAFHSDRKPISAM